MLKMKVHLMENNNTELNKKNSIPVKNVYYMLVYAHDCIDHNQAQVEDLSKEKFDNVLDILAYVLKGAVAQQVKRGLHKDYVPLTEDLPLLRGKLDIQGTIKLQMAQKQKLSCEYDEYSANNIHNQILKSTMHYLIRAGGVKDDTKRVFRSTLRYFSEVDIIDITAIRWDIIRYGRNNLPYDFLHKICRMIIENMLISTQSGDVKFRNFFDEKRMAHIFEKFVLKYYQTHYEQLQPKDSAIKWMEYEDTQAERAKHLPGMKTDITLTGTYKKHSEENTKKDTKKRILIIDTKYYTSNMDESFWGNKAIHKTNNLYQMFAYVKNKKYAYKDAAVSGMILYAQTDSETQPKSFYMFEGESIEITTIDLKEDFSKWKEQLDEIADNYFEIK